MPNPGPAPLNVTVLVPCLNVAFEFSVQLPPTVMEEPFATKVPVLWTKFELMVMVKFWVLMTPLYPELILMEETLTFVLMLQFPTPPPSKMTVWVLVGTQAAPHEAPPDPAVDQTLAAFQFAALALLHQMGPVTGGAAGRKPVADEQ